VRWQKTCAPALVDERAGVVDQHLAGRAAEVPERAFQTLQPRRLALVQKHGRVGSAQVAQRGHEQVAHLLNVWVFPYSFSCIELKLQSKGFF
jgi:hypothetical protein